MIESASTTSTQKRILDVGCGQNKYPGAIGIDANRATHADVIHDLGTFPYPFADNEFEEIICRHVIEHVPDVLGFVNELHRITGNFICIPKQMLKSDEAIMLDGMKISEVSRALGQPVHAVGLQELATLLLNKN